MCCRIVFRDQLNTVVALAMFVVMSIVVVAAMPAGAVAEVQDDRGEDTIGPQASPKNALPRFDCGYRAPVDWLHDLEESVARGEINDPATRPIPLIAPGRPRTALGELPCLSPAHIFPFEDANQLLLTNFSNAELIDLMVTAANERMILCGKKPGGASDTRPGRFR